MIAVVLVGGFLRFYNLMWGNGDFYHPDENNMARSISQMTAARALHPDFFAYGQFPLYLSYFLSQFLYFMATTFGNIELAGIFPYYQLSYKDAIFGLRFFAALFSTLTIPLVYLIIKEFTDKDHHHNEKMTHKHLFSFSDKTSFYPLMGALLTAFLPGLIQSSHFGTTESILTFLFLLVTYISLKLLQANKSVVWRVVMLGIAIGVSLGTKITAAFFFLPPFLGVVLSNITKSTSTIKTVGHKLLIFLTILAIATFFFIVSSPYSVFDWKNFRSTSEYESQVATGQIPVFYTRQFIDTVPILFQATHIFPYVLGPILYMTSIISFILLPLLIGKIGSKLLRNQYIVLATPFVFFLIINSLLFVKWTRFLTPLFPFMAIFTTLFFLLGEQFTKKTRLAQGIFMVVVTTTIISGLGFFSIYARPDVRRMASEWIYENIPQGSYVLSETGNVVDIPTYINEGHDMPDKSIGNHDYTVISFDFYKLDENPDLLSELVNHLHKSNYIFVPSRRIFSNHMRRAGQFPRVNNYYTALFNGNLGFKPVAVISSNSIVECASSTTECGSFQWIEDEQAEETWTVFDHPIVRIYQKVTKYEPEFYEQVLQEANQTSLNQ